MKENSLNLADYLKVNRNSNDRQPISNVFNSGIKGKEISGLKRKHYELKSSTGISIEEKFEHQNQQPSGNIITPSSTKINKPSYVSNMYNHPESSTNDNDLSDDNRKVDLIDEENKRNTSQCTSVLTTGSMLTEEEGNLNAQTNFKNAIDKVFIIEEVTPDGHCGYHAIINGLKRMNIQIQSVTILRKQIHDYSRDHVGDLFEGMKFSNDGRKQFIFNIQKQIYQEWMNDSWIEEKYWLDVGNVLPILAKMFPHITFMVYDLKICTTSTCYAGPDQSSLWNLYRFMKFPLEQSVCILYDGSKHFDFIYPRS